MLPLMVINFFALAQMMILLHVAVMMHKIMLSYIRASMQQIDVVVVVSITNHVEKEAPKTLVMHHSKILATKDFAKI